MTWKVITPNFVRHRESDAEFLPASHNAFPAKFLHHVDGKLLLLEEHCEVFIKHDVNVVRVRSRSSAIRS
ncbi:hypothetical protein D3C85_1729840 [compost metagenome]